MRFVLVVLAALAISFPLAASNAASVVPQQFRGEWHADASRCGDGEDESFLFIRAHSITFYESAGSVKATVVRKQELALILELSGEGETWLTTAQFELSPDTDTLTSSTVPGEPYVRHRCPGPQEGSNYSFKADSYAAA